MSTTRDVLALLYAWADSGDIPEMRRFANTIRRWEHEVLAYFTTGGASNGPTEAVNLTIKSAWNGRPVPHGSWVTHDRGRSHIGKEAGRHGQCCASRHDLLGSRRHKDSISVGILRAGEQLPDVERIFHDEDSVRRLIARFPDPSLGRACYEAGPTGYGLARLLRGMGVSCQVAAPALIPRAPGDKVKTDKRDCQRLARLFRAGELVAIRIPTEQEEAVRDLCRARVDMVSDVQRARRRLGSFLLRHGMVYRRGSAWTQTHERWLSSLRFDEPALRSTFYHYRAVVAARDAELRALEADLKIAARQEPFAEPVRRLAAYRGVAELGALTIASEVCDWRRFAHAPAFMGFTGLTPSEYSSGSSGRRGHVTKTGPGTCAPNLSSPRGRISIGRSSASDCKIVTRLCPRPPSSVPGKHSCACADASSALLPARTTRAWSSLPSLVSSRDSFGRR